MCGRFNKTAIVSFRTAITLSSLWLKSIALFNSRRVAILPITANTRESCSFSKTKKKLIPQFVKTSNCLWISSVFVLSTKGIAFLCIIKSTNWYYTFINYNLLYNKSGFFLSFPTSDTRKKASSLSSPMHWIDIKHIARCTRQQSKHNAIPLHWFIYP